MSSNNQDISFLFGGEGQPNHAVSHILKNDELISFEQSMNVFDIKYFFFFPILISFGRFRNRSADHLPLLGSKMMTQTMSIMI